MTFFFHFFTKFIEKFSTKAETKILRSVFALDTLMCQVENDLENLNPAKMGKVYQSMAKAMDPKMLMLDKLDRIDRLDKIDKLDKIRKVYQRLDLSISLIIYLLAECLISRK